MTAVLVTTIDDKPDGRSNVGTELIGLGSMKETQQAVNILAILAVMADESFLSKEQWFRVEEKYNELSKELVKNIERHNAGRWN